MYNKISHDLELEGEKAHSEFYTASLMLDDYELMENGFLHNTGSKPGDKAKEKMYQYYRMRIKGIGMRKKQLQYAYAHSCHPNLRRWIS